MARLSLSSLRGRFLLLVLLAVLPVLGLILYATLKQEKVIVLQAQAHASQLARLAVAGHERVLRRVRQHLMVLAQTPAVQSGTTVACETALIAEVLKYAPQYVLLAVASPEGSIMCCTHPLSDTVSLAGQAFFDRAFTTRSFTVGTSRLPSLTQKPALPFAYPVTDDKGTVQRVLVALLDLEWLYQAMVTAQLPDGSQLSLRDHTGTVLVRYPGSGQEDELSIPDFPLTPAQLVSQGGGTTEVVGSQGRRYIYAFLPLRDESTLIGYVTVGLPATIMSIDASRLLVRHFAWLGLAVGLAAIVIWLGADWLTRRMIHRVLDTTRRLLAGDLSARTGPLDQQGTLGRLARTVDAIGESLAQREAERERLQGEWRRRAEEESGLLNIELERHVAERTAQLEAANKELEAFSYSVSHDLRAPLRAVDGFSRILLEDYAPQLTSDATRYLQMVRESAQRMGSLIDDLLTFSRLGRQPLTKQSVALADLVRQTLAELRIEQENRQVEITIGELPPCQADPALLKQVMVNLLTNALKFTRRREVAHIEIGCHQLNGDQTYFVKDNGVGFDMQYVHKLFGVFQRLHRIEEYEGTGVGLAIVQRILNRHDGRVWAEAIVDGGATFYFTIGEEKGQQ